MVDGLRINSTRRENNMGDSMTTKPTWAAVNAAGEYLAVQGQKRWFQADCNGWAIASTDKGWIIDHLTLDLELREVASR
jgi:hypothetical protein